MSQAEIVKSPIISVVRGPLDAGKANGHHGVGARPSEAITTFAWNSSPIAIVEEVELPTPLDARLVTLSAPAAARAQSFRLLEHRLIAKGNPRVIAVTSAEPSAGKTTCAANLALVLAEAALSRVLLIDANLQRPGVADLFGFDPADSLMSKLLLREDAAPPYAVATVSGVSLQLAALHPQTARGKRLDRALFGEALRSLRSAYDYIVIDTASVLESADVHGISQCADGVVLVARAAKSRKGALRRAIQQLEPATVLGTVLLEN
jgi:Mrp family chromosome partitioning ATPase